MSDTNAGIYEYYDYRKYLRETYECLHKKDDRFSYRFIKQKTGIDPGYLVKVFNGSKHLSENSIKPLSKLLKHNKREAEYFHYLVLFGRAKSDTAIKNYFEKLLSFTELKSKRIDAASYEFYQKWYYSAIREILNYYPFDGNYAALAKMTVPEIKISEAKKSIELLTRLKFIKQDSQGKYHLTSQFITTGNEWSSIAIRQFQKETIHLAVHALENVDKNERDISTVSVTLSRKGFMEVRDKLKEFRKEILKIAQQEENVSGAYHINFQLVPIGKHFAVEDEE